VKIVTKEEFYKYIGPRDICISIQNVDVYPFTNLFKTRNGLLVGKITAINRGEQGNRIYPEIETYHLSEK
jgi:hypothetical protein